MDFENRMQITPHEMQLVSFMSMFSYISPLGSFMYDKFYTLLTSCAGGQFHRRKSTYFSPEWRQQKAECGRQACLHTDKRRNSWRLQKRWGSYPPIIIITRMHHWWIASQSFTFSSYHRVRSSCDHVLNSFQQDWNHGPWCIIPNESLPSFFENPLSSRGYRRPVD